MKKKLASVLLCAVMAASMLTGCGNSGDAAATTPATDSKTDVATTEAVETTAAADGSVYYLKLTKYGRSWLRNIPRRPVFL